MKSIGEYLSKFRNLEHPEKKKELLAELISKEIGTNLTKDNLIITGKILFIKVGGAAKSEAFLRRPQILQKIKETLPEIKIDDIR